MHCICDLALCVLRMWVPLALDHGPPRMWVPLANLTPHEYVLLTLSSKYIVVKHTVSLDALHMHWWVC